MKPCYLCGKYQINTPVHKICLCKPCSDRVLLDYCQSHYSSLTTSVWNPEPYTIHESIYSNEYHLLVYFDQVFYLYHGRQPFDTSLTHPREFIHWTLVRRDVYDMYLSILPFSGIRCSACLRSLTPYLFFSYVQPLPLCQIISTYVETPRHYFPSPKFVFP